MTETKSGGITGKGFVKGDARINRKGRPKSFDQLRKLAQLIAHETLPGGGMTVAEAMLRKWASSPDPRLQIMFITVAFGKVPDQVEIGGKDDTTIKIEYVDYRERLEQRSDV